MNCSEDLCERLRRAYRQGITIPNIIRNESAFFKSSPSEIMFKLMETFHIGLSDVSCIDGWWPPDSESEVTDRNVHIFIRDAIEKHRVEWDLE